MRRQLKSNGFELERFNLATEPRQYSLMAVMVFAYVVSVVKGLKHYTHGITFKVQGAAGLRYQSTFVFRYSIDNLARHT